MWTRQYKRSPLRHVVIPAIALLALGYYGFHGINGRLGLQSKQEYEQRLSGLRAELDRLATQRRTLETRTAALSDGSLQRDLIDEQARQALGLVQENEIVLIHDGAGGPSGNDALLRRSN